MDVWTLHFCENCCQPDECQSLATCFDLLFQQLAAIWEQGPKALQMQKMWTSILSEWLCCNHTLLELHVNAQVIKANDDLTPEHHQFFLYQMLRGLKYIHTGETHAPPQLSTLHFVIITTPPHWQEIAIIPHIPASTYRQWAANACSIYKATSLTSLEFMHCCCSAAANHFDLNAQMHLSCQWL